MKLDVAALALQFMVAAPGLRRHCRLTDAFLYAWVGVQ
jgi:hypothetical protein